MPKKRKHSRIARTLKATIFFDRYLYVGRKKGFLGKGKGSMKPSAKAKRRTYLERSKKRNQARLMRLRKELKAKAAKRRRAKGTMDEVYDEVSEEI